MKKRITIIILSCLFLFNCSDDESMDFPEELVGTWSSSAFSRTDCTDSDDEATCDTKGCMIITFSANGSYSGSYPEVALTGIATASATNLKLCTPDNDCTDVSYTLASDVLSASWVDNEDGCTYTAEMAK